mmetsp:Transcript_11023/g.22382  ORF Transcript_11023/g.22382 Transcript_11023/m.22382 type:complete len:114 (-) Transcript_11023:194-535(-)
MLCAVRRGLLPRAAVRSLWSASACRLGSHSGYVKFFNAEKGFGFIAGETEDYFVHYTAIQSEGFKTLAENEKVEFDLQPDARSGGLKAANVTGPGGAPVQGQPKPERGSGGME